MIITTAPQSRSFQQMSVADEALIHTAKRRYRAIPIRRESPPLCPFRPSQQQQGAETGASCALELASLSPRCEIAEVTEIEPSWESLIPFLNRLRA
jgi:hypothetical protein